MLGCICRGHHATYIGLDVKSAGLKEGMTAASVLAQISAELAVDARVAGHPEQLPHHSNISLAGCLSLVGM